MPISAYDTMNYAQFTPLSIQEMWAPSQQLRAQHDQLQEEFAQQEQAGGLSLLGLKEGIDDEAIKIHKTYMDETKRAADELATKGFIDSGRRRNLYGLKQQYNQNVVPLQNQLKIRQDRAEELRRMQLQDPTFRATLNPNEIGLTSGLKNPEAFNYSGVSGNQMYKSVAEKANQLSKVIEQEHPELIKSKLAYNYFTAVQSGASLEQVDAAMRRQFNPKDVDKMTNLMRGIVESTFNEFGVPQKFANNPQVQDELWQTASQGLYAALGSKQFGTMHDSWGMEMRKRELDKTPPPEGGRGDYDYVPGFDDSGIKSVEKVKSNIDKSIKQIDYTKSQIDKIARKRPWSEIPENDRLAIKVLYRARDKANNSLWEIKDELENLGIEIPKELRASGLDDPKLISFLDRAIPQAEENYKFANKSILFRDLGDKEVDKIQSYIYSNSKGLKNINGKEVKFDQVIDNGRIIGAPKYILNKHGFSIALNKKDGGQEIIKGDINDLGSPTIAAYYKSVMQVEKDKKDMSDRDFKEVYKISKEDLDLTPNYNALESDIRGRTNTYIATVPIPGQ